MKMRKILFLIIPLFLSSCGANIAPYEEPIKPNLVDESPALAEKHEFDIKETDKRLVLPLSNMTSVAYAAYEAKYNEKGITFHFEFNDDDIYARNIYDIGYDDNIEIVFGLATEKRQWVIGQTFHFLINGAGKIYFQKANSLNSFGTTFETSMHAVLGENIIVNYYNVTTENYGWNGFVADVFFSYDVLNTTYADGLGQITVCPAGRNTHMYRTDTMWQSYTQKGCIWADASTHIMIDEQGNFLE